MRKRLNARMPSAAMAVAILALGIALGGGAYAAKVKLKANSVKTKTIKNGAVTEKKLRDGAVTEGKLAGGAVSSAKLTPCKSGTVLVRGDCWETGVRPALNWFAASDACGAAGGRLPLSTELMAIRNEPGFNLGSNGASTSNMAADQIANAYSAVDDNGAVSLSLTANTTPRPFRCVLPHAG
jgi:hypothetical protein